MREGAMQRTTENDPGGQNSEYKVPKAETPDAPGSRGLPGWSERVTGPGRDVKGEVPGARPR